MAKIESARNLLESYPVDDASALINDNSQFYVFEWNGMENLLAQPYRGPDFYKISLVEGSFKFWYAGHDFETSENTLLFVNQKLPFTWQLSGEQSGYCCFFTNDFFNFFDYFKDYSLFSGNHAPAFDLSNEDMAALKSIYLKMFRELDSDFIYKFDILRTLVLELIYTALKLQPVQRKQHQDSNASQRIVNQFMELLEQQFSIATVGQKIKIRFPADFADQLSVHINHLNRALKDITGSTTTQTIAKRIFKEAMILLQYTDWNISEIGWCLGFEELPHFINFFKKRAKLTPKAFRQQQQPGLNSIRSIGQPAAG